jgi:hypothetical protein
MSTRNCRVLNISVNLNKNSKHKSALTIIIPDAIEKCHGVLTKYIIPL